jgi:NADH:ubiquinone oxidoreductase subunit F (NADH-binding)
VVKTTAAVSDLAVAVWPGLTPRLLRTPPGIEDLTQYRGADGYRPLDEADTLLEQVELSGLLGRGGAAFPMAVKLRSVRDAGRLGSDTVVVANGEEGEPASVKDRWLMRHRPHLVVDGVRLASRIVGASRAVLYVSDPGAESALASAVTELDDDARAGVTITVVRVEPGYVAGEETAAVRAINGGPAKPTDKPPRPYQQGVSGLPTLVSNVETLACLPFLHQHGAEAFRAEGTSASPGTFLMTITGGTRAPALYEVAHGVPFAELLAAHQVPAESLRGVLMGGYFAGMLNREVLDTTLDHETLRRLGGGLGSGAISLLTEDCPVAVAASVMAYFDRENAGQCGSCFNGTAAMSAVTAALRDQNATDDDLTRLERWSVVLRGRGACATLDAATNVAASLLRAFPQDVARHIAGNCEECRIGPFGAVRPYEVEAFA